MPDSAKSKFVFVDTQVFDRHQLSFDSPNIVRLTKLAVSGTIEPFLTTITEKEIRSHLDKQATTAFQQLKNYNRASQVVKRVLPQAEFEPADEASFRAGLHQEFDAFLAESNLRVLGVEQVSAEDVFAAYFEQRPPFDTQDKKSEFPDAFAIAALRNWCDANDAEMYVVTGDKDWKRACKFEPRLLFVDSLEGLLQNFQDSEVVLKILAAIHSRSEVIEQLIIAEAAKLDVSVSDNLVDADHEDFSVDGVEFSEFHVVEAEDGEATVSVYCTLSVSAHVMADDPDSMWKDPDSGDMNSVWKISGTIEQELEIEVSIGCTYELDSPENIVISSVDLECDGIELDPEEGELSRDDDEEHDDDCFGPDTY